MTNTLKHLALLARMESSGLKLGLTGKFPEDALDQTCERVESFQLQNRLRTGWRSAAGNGAEETGARLCGNLWNPPGMCAVERSAGRAVFPTALRAV